VSIDLLLFWAFALLALFSSIAMVAFVRHVVASAMSLVVTMISLAGIYVLLAAEFVAVVQIMVYAGAILVLFLFVIMLLNLQEEETARATSGPKALKLAGAVASVGVGVALVVRAADSFSIAPPPESLPQGFGGYRTLGIALYTEYVLALELAGLILLAAIIGAVVLAKRRLD